MADQCQPTTLDHAEAMLAHLRAQPAGYGHELARAMLASASVYLTETFGQHHARQVAASLVPPVLGVAEAAEPAPGKGGPVEAPPAAPAVTLH